MLEHGGRLRAAAQAYGTPLAGWLDLSTGINPRAYPVPPLPPEHARFQGIVNKLLAKDPKDRYQSADEMVAAIKKHRAGAPSAAEPATRRVDTAVSSPLQEKLKRLSASESAGGETTVNQPTGPQNPYAETAVSKPIGAVPPKVDTPAPSPSAAAKGKPLALYRAIAALVVVIGGGVAFWPKPQSTSPKPVLDAVKRAEMVDKLSAARTMLKLGNTDGAAELYEIVVDKFDCTESEARDGLRATSPDRYERLLKECPVDQ